MTTFPWSLYVVFIINYSITTDSFNVVNVTASPLHCWCLDVPKYAPKFTFLNTSHYMAYEIMWYLWGELADQTTKVADDCMVKWNVEMNMKACILLQYHHAYFHFRAALTSKLSKWNLIGQYIIMLGISTHIVKETNLSCNWQIYNYHQYRIAQL